MQRLLLLFCLLNLQTVVTASASDENLITCAICREKKTPLVLPCKCPPENKCCDTCFWQTSIGKEKPHCLLCMQPCRITFPTDPEIPKKSRLPITSYQISGVVFGTGLEIENPKDPNIPFSLLYIPIAKTAFWGMGNNQTPTQVPPWLLARLLSIALKNGKAPLDTYSSLKQEELPFLPDLLKQARLSCGPNNPENENQLQKFIRTLKE